MSELLLVVVLSAHLVCVGIAAAGPAVCAWLEWKEGQGDEAAGRAGRFLAGLSWWLLVIGGVLGVVVGVLVWSEEYARAVKLLGRRIQSGVGELLFSLVLMLVHSLWWRMRPRVNRLGRLARMSLPLLASTNLLYHFPLLFFVLQDVVRETVLQAAASSLTHAEFRERLTQGVMAKTVHFWLASAAMAGAALMVFALRVTNKESDHEDAGGRLPSQRTRQRTSQSIEGMRVSSWGGRISAATVMLQIPVGIWVLAHLSPTQQRSLMGGDPIALALFLFSLLAAMALMHQFAAIGLRGGAPGELRRAIGLLMMTVVLMVGASRRAKIHAKDPNQLRETTNMSSPEIIHLSDPEHQTQAAILAGYGFNCFRFQAMDADQGDPVELIWSEKGFEHGNDRPSGSGIPILFPFPGRIPGVKLSWEGKEYELEAGDGSGNAIHGFVHERPWRVIEHSGKHVVGCFHAAEDDPSLLARWPSDFRIRAEYRLDGNTLSLDLLVENPGEAPLPCGLGVHPYFRVALGGGNVNQCVVQLPVTEQWELAQMLATGKRLPLEDAAQYQGGLKFGEMAFDNVFTGLGFDGGMELEGEWCVARIVDGGIGRSTVIFFDTAFRECVVYNPAHREAVCIEPYTCVPGPFHLTRQGVDAGLRVLGPGKSFTAKVVIRMETEG